MSEGRDERSPLPRVTWTEEEDDHDLWEEITPAGSDGGGDEPSPSPPPASGRGKAAGSEDGGDEPLPAPPPGPSSPPSPELLNEAKRALARPLVVSRRPLQRAPKEAPKSVRSEPPPPRRYPKMLALLQDPEHVPDGSDPMPEPEPPPVPGTFFPAARVPLERPAPADLDQLLATMAEGLLIGENDAGETEARVTLKDEFFAGTELRITVGAGEVQALLVPPDRDIYWQLTANVRELEERLASRGLRVREIRVAEP